MRSAFPPYTLIRLKESAIATSATPAAHPQRSLDPRDKWLWWPMISALGAWFLFSFLDGMPGLLSFILIPVSILSLLLAAGMVLILGCALIARRRPRKALSLTLALLAPFICKEQINRAADCLHLALTVEFGFGVLNP